MIWIKASTGQGVSYELCQEDRVERQIIALDTELCTDCGFCVEVCESQMLVVVDGRAGLRTDEHCSGCGECIGQCPEGALRLVWRQAEPFRG